MFIHLHTHSAFSFLDGGSSIESLVKRAAELDMPALALTDHDNLCGAVKFNAQARKAGIKPIQGVEVTLDNGHHLTLLARNPEGYRNLCRMLTAAHLKNPRRHPRVSLGNLRDHAGGLIALSGCRKGEIPHCLLLGNYEEAYRVASIYLGIWGPQDFYLEMQGSYLPGDIQLNASLEQLARQLGVGVVASNNVHYASPDDFKVHDVLSCVRALVRVDDVNPDRPLNAENYLKTSREMELLFKEYPEALENTWRIAERCELALDLDTPHFPAFDLPPGQKAASLLRELTYQGAYQKYQKVSPVLQERLEHELAVINALGYADYFLVVWDIVRHARLEGIRYAGRGSAADSVVAYCLGITEVDALERGLLFERFMSLERGEKPDIDLDFDARYRDRVAEYVYHKYGRDKVASVCTYNTFRARSALRDIGKALGLPEAELDYLAKKLPHIHADQIKTVLPRLPELQGSGLDSKKFELLLDLCEKVAGFPRFLGTHLGGLVVSREPLNELTPLQQAAKGMVITQFDKDDVEDLGLIKLDLLSLRTMSAIEDAMTSIHRGSNGLNYDRIPLDDPDTYKLINSGKTIGIFQLESPAQRALQARMGACVMEDVVASMAIIRPGPIKGNMVEPYIARRQGLEPVTYLHPILEPILAKTYGVILFQEQVIEIATAVAKFSPGEADQLRRVMTHARSHRAMEEIGETFVAKAIANGFDPELAKTIFSCIAGYASYGFCEGHAAAFATTSFKTAYLVRHYPVEFYAAILSNQPMGYYPPRIICGEARRRGIKILPPHINLSGESFEAIKDPPSIRISLSQVKGLSRNGLASILENRPFVSLMDLVIRSKLNVDEMQSLIKCGALDVFDNNRRRLSALLPDCLQHKKDYDRGEDPLFSGGGDGGLNIPDFSPIEKHLMESEILGIATGDHIMARVRNDLTSRGFASTRELSTLPEGKWVKVAGILFRPHRPPTRSGRVTVFMSLEDEFGLVDVTVFEDVYQKYGNCIFSPQTGPLVVEGVLQRRGNLETIIAKKIGCWDRGTGSLSHF
ncbi:MAG: DNA polymerase III subunit alpha [Syntrophomonadales bacterium]